MKTIQVLLPALVITEEQQKMTDECKRSILSLEHCLKVDIDTRKYPDKIAGVWNTFFDKWRGQEYDYLLVSANDTLLDPCCIDYLVRCMEEHPEAGIVSALVTRDLDQFKKGYGQQEYSGQLTEGYANHDPANWLIRPGVIEAVGRVDPEFPLEFVERDFLYRCKLAGYAWIQPKEVLNYHPPFSGTIGNEDERLRKALRKYLLKWGGDAGSEKYTRPYNDLRLDITYCKNEIRPISGESKETV